MLNSELANFVERSDLERWNESLAVMLVHGDSRVLSNMTEELGGRL